MKQLRALLGLSTAAAMLVSLAACSAGSAATAAVNYGEQAMAASSAAPEAAYDGGAYKTETRQAVAMAAAGAENGGELAGEVAYDEAVAAESGTGGAAAPTVMDPTRKLIRTVALEIETKEYDVLTQKLLEQVALVGGYVETSRMVGGAYLGNGYDDNYYYGYTGNGRNTYVIARIPRDKVDAFIATLGEHGSIRSRQENVQDVTLEYVDVESRKKSLTVEYERLMALLEKADSLEVIVALEQRLTDVRYELESMESQLRVFDNQVSYSTVTVSITEVQRISPLEEQKKSVGQRIADGFSTTLYQLARGGEDFIVWFVVNIPYLLIWAIVIAVLVFGIRRLVRKMGGQTKEQRRTLWKNALDATGTAPEMKAAQEDGEAQT